jgi:16S rRNA (uracil1498-N3)-methyltransferase
MRRFFAPPEVCRANVFDLPEREARHAAQVLRLEPGDALTVLDGAGAVLECRVEAATRRAVRVAVQSRVRRPAPPAALTLAQAIPKGPAFDTIVQKATELGAARIVPVLSERVVVQVRPADGPAKVEKWRQIAIESVKQCGSPWLPEIVPPISLKELLARPPAADDLALVASLEPDARDLRTVVAETCRATGRPPRSALVWIGPEGDFTPDEYAAIRATGAQPISLGPLVLRADTAAICALALVRHELAAPAPSA